MLIVLQQGHSEKDILDILGRLNQMGFTGHVSQGVERTVIGVVGQPTPQLKDAVETWPNVDEVVPISKPYKLASREFKPENTIVKVGNVTIGGNKLAIMAGPCAVESEEQVISIAQAVKAAGANILRGGAYKPSTSPYSFRGMGKQGLKLLEKAGKETGMPVITEVMSPEDVDMVAEYADILQVGARSMQNFFLLDEVGKSKKPVMLKRGLAATIQEWLLSAEYILSQGNTKVILCARGIRTFETYTRNTMDLDSIPIIKKLSHLPIIADPSHGTGKWYLVTPMALAAVAAGADGLMVEVHPQPDTAMKDGAQSLTFENFNRLMTQVTPVASSIGRSLP
jgi:3-deoxy-7-phosphoheptulonate synthase